MILIFRVFKNPAVRIPLQIYVFRMSMDFFIQQIWTSLQGSLLEKKLPSGNETAKHPCPHEIYIIEGEDIINSKQTE